MTIAFGISNLDSLHFNIQILRGRFYLKFFRLSWAHVLEPWWEENGTRIWEKKTTKNTHRYTSGTHARQIFMFIFGLRRSCMNSTCWTFDAPTKELKRQRKQKNKKIIIIKQTNKQSDRYIILFCVVRTSLESHQQQAHSHSHVNEKELENWNEFFYTLT